MSSETQARPYAQAIFEHSEEWTEDIEERESVLVDENDAEEEIQQMQKETES